MDDIELEFLVSGAAALAARRDIPEDRVSDLADFLNGHAPLLISYTLRGDPENALRVLFLHSATNAVQALSVDERGKWQALFLGVWAEAGGSKALAVRSLENGRQSREVSALLAQWSSAFCQRGISKLDDSHRDFAQEEEDRLRARWSY